MGIYELQYYELRYLSKRVQSYENKQKARNKKVLNLLKKQKNHTEHSHTFHVPFPILSRKKTYG